MKISVVVDDRVIVVDGVARCVPANRFHATENVHAIQWQGASGFVERKMGGQDYVENFDMVKPFADLHAAILEEEAAAAAAAAAEVPQA